MNVGTRSRCKHVYLHVDRRFHTRGQGRGLIPVWRCFLKKTNPKGVCGELTKLGIETSCHPEECALATKYMPWDKCPFYTPLF